MAHLFEFEADEVLVQRVGGFDQLAGAVGAVGRQNPVLYVAVTGHEHKQDAFFREGDEFDLADARADVARCDDDTGEMGQVGKQTRRLTDDLPGLRLGADQFGNNTRLVDLLQGLHGEQGVDEKPVATRRGDAPGGGVRAGDEAQIFEIGHDVAYRGRRQIQARNARQRPRADGCAFGDITFDQRLE